MPRTKKKTEDEEIEDLIEELDDEEVEDDEELEDEDEELDEEDEEEEDEEEEDEEEEDVDDEDEEDPDAAPKARTRSRTRKAKAAPKKKDRAGIGTAELADAAGVDSRTLRMYLRSKGIEKTEGRYEWKSLNDPEAKSILRGLRDKEHKVVQKERLDNLKKGKSTAKKTGAKKTSTRARTATKTSAGGRRRAR